MIEQKPIKYLLKLNSVDFVGYNSVEERNQKDPNIGYTFTQLLFIHIDVYLKSAARITFPQSFILRKVIAQ